MRNCLMQRSFEILSSTIQDAFIENIIKSINRTSINF